jgi:hypothetical protein
MRNYKSLGAHADPYSADQIGIFGPNGNNNYTAHQIGNEITNIEFEGVGSRRMWANKLVKDTN